MSDSEAVALCILLIAGGSWWATRNLGPGWARKRKVKQEGKGAK